MSAEAQSVNLTRLDDARGLGGHGPRRPARASTPSRIAGLARVHYLMAVELDRLEDCPPGGSALLHAEVIAGSLREMLDRLDEILVVAKSRSGDVPETPVRLAA